MILDRASEWRKGRDGYANKRRGDLSGAVLDETEGTTWIGSSATGGATYVRPPTSPKATNDVLATTGPPAAALGSASAPATTTDDTPDAAQGGVPPRHRHRPHGRSGALYCGGDK